jgi:outer membrane protein assembly factor BamA
MISRQTVEVDARYYKRLLSNGVLAFRARGYNSWGDFPGYLYFGGNSELRGYEYLEFLGNKAFFANAELRFPIIEAALTPFGVVGGLRGVFFAGLGAAGYEGVNQQFRVWTNDPVQYTPLIGVEQDPDQLPGILRPVFGPTTSIDGFKLIDGRASYGVGLETFALGFPIHFDWSWRTMFNREYEDAVYQFQGLAENMRGSDWFRKVQFAVWIGYNF